MGAEGARLIPRGGHGGRHRGNGIAGQTVTLSIDPTHNPGGSTLTCTPSSCQAGTDASGVASFSASLDKDGLGYELQATQGALQANSDPFKIGDVKTCSGNNCLLNGNADGSSTSASVNGVSGDLLALGFDGSIQTASGKCGVGEQMVLASSSCRRRRAAPRAHPFGRSRRRSIRTRRVSTHPGAFPSGTSVWGP